MDGSVKRHFWGLSTRRIRSLREFFVRSRALAQVGVGTVLASRAAAQPWISQPSVARAASITASAKAGWGWIVRATSW